MVFGMYFLLKTHYNPRIIDLYPKGIKMFECGFFKNVRKQSGFTLLELLVVIAVIGVLASLAVPRFQNYIKKAKFVEVVSAAGPFKTAVEVCAQHGVDLKNCTEGANGIPAAATASTNAVVSSVTVAAGGVITATGGASVDGDTYILTPLPPALDTSSTGLSWAVSGTCTKHGLCSN